MPGVYFSCGSFFVCQQIGVNGRADVRARSESGKLEVRIEREQIKNMRIEMEGSFFRRCMLHH